MKSFLDGSGFEELVAYLKWGDPGFLSVYYGSLGKSFTAGLLAIFHFLSLNYYLKWYCLVLVSGNFNFSVVTSNF
jgi:hypothetical protein